VLLRPQYRRALPAADSLRGLARQLVRYGRGRVRLLRKHRETFAVKTMLPAVFLAGCLAGPLVAWTSAPS